MNNTSLVMKSINVGNNEMVELVIGEATVCLQFLVANGVVVCQCNDSMVHLNSNLSSVLVDDFKMKILLQRRIDQLQSELDNYVSLVGDIEVVDFEIPHDYKG